MPVVSHLDPFGKLSWQQYCAPLQVMVMHWLELKKLKPPLPDAGTFFESSLPANFAAHNK